MKRSKSRLTTAEMVEMYQSGKSTTEISDKAGISVRAVTNRLHKAGIDMRPQGWGNGKSRLSTERMHELNKQGLNITQIAELAGITRRAVNKRFAWHGIKKREYNTESRRNRGARQSVVSGNGIKEHVDGYLSFTFGAYKDRPVHRVVMELHLRRKLKPTEHVHHINHDKRDNRIQNLEVIDCREHSRQHVRETQKRIFEARA